MLPFKDFRKIEVLLIFFLSCSSDTSPDIAQNYKLFQSNSECLNGKNIIQDSLRMDLFPITYNKISEEYRKQPEKEGTIMFFNNQFDKEFENSLRLKNNEKIGSISENQKYISVLRYDTINRQADSLEVFVKNFKSNLISYFKIPSIGFEGYDIIKPSNDGLSVIQDDFTGKSSEFIGAYRWYRKNGKSEVDTLFSKKKVVGIDFSLSNEYGYSIISYIDKGILTENTSSYLDKIDADNTKIWNLSLIEKVINSSVFVDFNNNICSFICKNVHDEYYLYIINITNQSEILLSEKIRPLGGRNTKIVVFNHSNKDFLVAYGGNNYYVVDLSDCRIISHNDHLENNFLIGSIIISKDDMIVGTAYTHKRVKIGDQGFNYLPDHKIIFKKDLIGNSSQAPLEVKGKPTIFLINSELFLSDYNQIDNQNQILFYRIVGLE